MKSTELIAPRVEAFFRDYLSAQKGLSPNTIFSYRDSLKLLLGFCTQRLGKHADKLTLEDFDEKLAASFLDDLEATRGNTPETRNNRLAALHSFFRYVAEREPTVMARCQRICAIPRKRTDHKVVEYFEDEEIKALLESVDQTARSGARDYALLLFLYNTGARAGEVVDLKIADLRLEAPYQVKLTGKGRKERVCPLWPETVLALQNYLSSRAAETSEETSVFLNSIGEPITRFGIRYIVRKYGYKATKACSSLGSKRLSPHTIRHTTAMHLLQSGNDISVVKDWLGHADMSTTHRYVEIDMKMKRKALEAAQPPKATVTPTRRTNWLKPSILKWLEQLSKPQGIMCSARQDLAFARPNGKQT